MVQQQIDSSYDTSDVNLFLRWSNQSDCFSADTNALGLSCWLSTVSLLPLLYLSMPSNLTVLCVLLLCVCPYVPWWVACKRADAISEENQRVHHLSDNCPHDQYLYAVTIHTGPCSAACMSAKVKCCASYVTV